MTDAIRALDTVDLALVILAAGLGIVGLYARDAWTKKLRALVTYVMLMLKSWRYK